MNNLKYLILVVLNILYVSLICYMLMTRDKAPEPTRSRYTVDSLMNLNTRLSKQIDSLKNKSIIYDKQLDSLDKGYTKKYDKKNMLQNLRFELK